MQIPPSQVVVQLASASFGSAELPVFSISTSPAAGGEPGTVQISALARAMAGVAPVGATPQLNLAVQYVGSFGTGSSLSFTPFSPAAAAADRYAIIDSDPGQEAREAAAESLGIPEPAATESAAEVLAAPPPVAAEARTAYAAVAETAAPAATSVAIDVSV